MRRLGVKLWTNDVFKNHPFFSEIVNHVKEGRFDYLELFTYLLYLFDLFNLLFRTNCFFY